ncbi:MAG TPA: CoA pyrophosphatase [Candidatus Deferrimicrobium sp.]|nr:CoA pyrophosphatase [Candidatus Deferrimicrobium sp.]
MKLPTLSELEDLIRKKLENIPPFILNPPDFKRSAVLMPIIFDENQLKFILTLRKENLRRHSGEISFPGGRQDKEDKDLEVTALRETYEEVGIAPKKIKILGRLDDLFTITGYIITPFIGIITETVQCKSNDAEVAEILYIPLEVFLTKALFSEKNLVRNNTNYPLYYYQWNNYEIWGATAYIINQFIELIFDFQPSTINFKRKDPDIIRKLMG